MCSAVYNFKEFLGGSDCLLCYPCLCCGFFLSLLLLLFWFFWGGFFVCTCTDCVKNLSFGLYHNHYFLLIWETISWCGEQWHTCTCIYVSTWTTRLQVFIQSRVNKTSTNYFNYLFLFLFEKIYFCTWHKTFKLCTWYKIFKLSHFF